MIPTMPGRMYVVRGRFGNKPYLYRAATMPLAPLRTTATEAEADELAWQKRNRHA